MGTAARACLVAWVGGLGWWLGAANPVGAEMSAAAPSLAAVIAEALERSAELAAIRARVAAAETMVEPARALPDPMASVGLSNIPVGEGTSLARDPMSGVMLMLSQQVPRAEKRRLRGIAQAQEAKMLRRRADDLRNRLSRDVRKAYLDLQYLDQAIAITEQNKAIAEDLLAAAEARYAAGLGLMQDVFQAQVRLSRMLDMLLELGPQRAAAAARLNALRHRPPEEPIGRLAEVKRTEVLLDSQSLIQRAIRANPGLHAMAIEAERGETQAALAAQEVRPDYTLSLSYMLRERAAGSEMGGAEMWSVTVGFELPWLRRRQRADPMAAAARAEAESARQHRAAMENELRRMVSELVIEIGRADQQLSLVESALLPQAEAALASSRAAYETGQVEFASLLDSQMSFYSEQLRRASLLADRERRLAELDYLVAGPAAPPAEEAADAAR